MPNANKNYQAIRSALIRKGTNLRRWAQENKLPLSTVYGAASGDRSGIIATKIRNRLIDYARN